MDTREIFREMIAGELRRGQLTSARRRELLQYAGQLRIPARQVEEWIAACNPDTLHTANAGDHSSEYGWGLHTRRTKKAVGAADPMHGFAFVFKLAAVALIAVVLGLLVAH